MVLEACWLERADVSHKQADARIGRQARAQVTDAVGASRQPAYRRPLKPPRARRGLALRVRRTVRRRETAWCTEASFELTWPNDGKTLN